MSKVCKKGDKIVRTAAGGGLTIGEVYVVAWAGPPTTYAGLQEIKLVGEGQTVYVTANFKHYVEEGGFEYKEEVDYKSSPGTWYKGIYIAKHPNTEGVHVILNRYGHITKRKGNDIRKPPTTKTITIEGKDLEISEESFNALKNFFKELD